MKKDIFYLFSSAGREQYKQDVIDVVGAPNGYVIGFRYDKNRWIHENVYRLKKEEIENKQGLVVYVEHRGKKEGEKEILKYHPIRMVTIKKVKEVGATYKLFLEMNNFYIANNLNLFNEEIKEKVPDLPYIGHNDGKFFTKAVMLQNIRKENMLNGFEKLVEELSETQDYKDNAIFYCIHKIEELSPKHDKEIFIKNFKGKTKNVLILNSARSYRLNFYHHNRDISGKNNLQVLLVKNEAFLESISDDRLRITSTYDENEFVIYTKRLHANKFSRVNVKRNKESKVMMPNLSIPVVIKYSKLYTFGWLTLIFVGLVGAALATNIANSSTKLFWIIVSSLAATAGVFFELRKD